MKKKISLSLLFVMAMISSLVQAAGIDPVLITPEEQTRQRQLDSQEQQRKQEILKTLREQQEMKPDVRGDSIKQLSPRASIEIPNNESPCFIINEIELLGEDAKKFQFSLDEALVKNVNSNSTETKSILGSCLGVLGINAVMNRVQNVIVAKGFVTTRVLTAPQDLKTGILQFTIIPGRVNNIRLTPDSNRYISPWLAIPITTGDILNLRDLEQGLENLKRIPTADASFQIEPADHAKPGYSDIVIHYKQKFPFRITLGIDDSGLNSTGKYLGSTTLSGDNLLALSDMFYINYNHDLGGGEKGKRGTKGYSVHYSIPWDYWLFSAATSSNNYHQEVVGALQNYIYSGSSQNAELKLNRLVYRNSINKTNVSLRGFLRKSFNYIDDTEIEVQRRRTAGWELGLNQSWYLGSAILDYNLAYRRGTGAMAALDAPEQGSDEGTSRMKMLIGDLNLSVPFSLRVPWGSQPLQYSANLRGQANYTPLATLPLPYQQLGPQCVWISFYDFSLLFI